MGDLDDLLERLELLLNDLEAADEPIRTYVFEFLDGIDSLHRRALTRLGDELGPDGIAELSAADPAIAWLFDAYAVGIDEKAAADRALDRVRPYIASHGGEIELLDASGGVVRVRLSGSCSGCTASQATLSEGVEAALREHLPGFVRLVAEEEPGESHPPPVSVPVELKRRP